MICQQSTPWATDVSICIVVKVKVTWGTCSDKKKSVFCRSFLNVSRRGQTAIMDSETLKMKIRTPAPEWFDCFPLVENLLPDFRRMLFVRTTHFWQTVQLSSCDCHCVMFPLSRIGWYHCQVVSVTVVKLWVLPLSSCECYRCQVVRCQVVSVTVVKLWVLPLSSCECYRCQVVSVTVVKLWVLPLSSCECYHCQVVSVTTLPLASCECNRCQVVSVTIVKLWV